MAVGDLIGEVGSTYLTAAQRAAKAGLNPSLMDGLAPAAGPVARATQQLTSLSQLAPPFTPPTQAATPSLASAYTPPGTASPSLQTTSATPSLSGALPGSVTAQPATPAPQLSLSSASPGGQQQAPTPQPPKAQSLADAGSRIGAGLLGVTPAASQPSPSLNDAAPIGVRPIAGSPAYPTAGQQALSLSDAAPAGPATAAPAQPATLSLDQYRPVVGGNSATASAGIVGRLSPDGTAEFSNRAPDLASAYGQPQISASVAPTAARTASLADAAPGASPSFGSLGSASNLGDGIGTFSQSNAGDAKLAMERNLRAIDLRQGFNQQDALARARQQANIDNSFTTVRDSSKPLTRSDLAQAGLDQQARDNDQKAIATAQEGITTGLAQRVAATQARQAQGLEDLRTAASAPNATPEQKAAYQSAIDPTGEKTLALQSQRAQLANTQAETALRLQQEKNNEVTQQQAQQDRVRAQAGKAATIDQAIGSVDALLGTKVDPKNPSGPRLNEDPGLEAAVGRSSILPTIPGGDAADFEARLDVLKAQSFLPQVEQLKGAGALSDAEGKKLSDSVGALSTKMSEGAFRKSLQDIRTTFAAAKARLPAPATGGASTAQASSIPTVTSKAQADALPAGSVFIGPDGKQYRK